MPSFACVVLVDRRGWVLLQERDEHAPIDPETLGHERRPRRAGEDVEAAAYRELLEETGLDLPPGTLRHHTTLRRLPRGLRQHRPGRTSSSPAST